MINNEKLQIGTSGWSYNHWKGFFYPEKISGKDMLSYYSDHFSTVELNTTFYRLPKRDTLKKWRQTVPNHFQFAVKASRFITHQKKLKDPQQSIAKFFDRIELLQEKLGPILFQLPPNWHKNGERISNFVKVLPSDYRYTFEFRDPSWFDENIIDLLRKTNTAFCIYDLEGKESPLHETANFVYIRLHGPSAKYQGSYSEKLLQKWVERLQKWGSDDKEVFCYFNNDYNGHAPRNAKLLLDMSSNKSRI